jgi:hypothetical protein
MREADIVLVCSRLEAFGRVGVEAMLLGKPVIYAAAGGSLEYMVDGYTGIAYPPGDAGALAQAIRRLADDPTVRQTLGRQAQAYARGRFNREAYGGQVFQKLCALRAMSCSRAVMPSIMQSLVGSALSELAAAREQVCDLSARLEAAKREIAGLRRTVVSAEQWQRRWIKRAFSRWHPPGTNRERVGPLKRLERALRKRRKRLAESSRRFRISK